MRIIATLATLLAMTALGFALDPNRNRMNDQYPQAGPEESLGQGPTLMPPMPPAQALTGLPPADANRMNYQSPEVPVSELAAVPDPSENRLNYTVPQPESSAQAEKPAKHKSR